MIDDSAQRIKAAMADRGISQRELGRSIGLDEVKISKSLNGSRRFTSLELALLADELETTVDWFLTGRRAPSWSFAARASQPVGAHLEPVAPVMERLLDAYDGARALGGLGAPPDLPVPADTWSFVEQGRQAAGLAGARLPRAIQDLELPELVTELERTLGLLVKVVPLPDGCDGLSFAAGDFRAVLLAPTDVPERHRHTLAHELGHIIFGDAEDRVVDDSVDSSGAKSIEEKRADAFAAHFLVPRAELLRELGGRSPLDVFSEMCFRFSAAPTTMAWRLYNEELIDESARRRLASSTGRRVAAELGKAGEYSTRCQLSSQPRAPWHLVEAYLKLHEQGVATLNTVAALLEWDIEATISFFARREIEESIWDELGDGQ